MSKRSARAGSRLPGDAGVVLLPPRLQPLSAEQRPEAVALLSDLLLAAVRVWALAAIPTKKGHSFV